MSQIWVVKTVLVATDLFADFLQGFRMIISQRSELERCWTCHLMGYPVRKMRISYDCRKIAPTVPMVIRRSNMTQLFQPRIQAKKTIMKEQDQWCRYENCCKTHVVQNHRQSSLHILSYRSNSYASHDRRQSNIWYGSDTQDSGTS